MSTKKKVLILLALFVVLGGIYWGFGNTSLTIPVTYLYYALCMILSILYVLVAGGIRPILDADAKREEKSRKQYLADKGKLHPIKRREKYRRFRVKDGEETPMAEEKKELPPTPNLLKIPEEKRGKWCTVLLLGAIPFYLIFILDWIYLQFFV